MSCQAKYVGISRKIRETIMGNGSLFNALDRIKLGNDVFAAFFETALCVIAPYMLHDIPNIST